MKVLVTGATGLIGRHLVHKLLVTGHDVFALARSPDKLPELPEKNIFRWDDQQLAPVAALIDCDAVIHLAGEGIADQRWSPARKKRLWDSRVTGTRNLVEAISATASQRRPKLLISSSAIGIYPESSVPVDEESETGSGFLSELCTEWEKQAFKAQDCGVRTVILRTGLVLAQQGGVLQKVAPVILGNGKQWMSWIHIDDFVNFICHALENQNLSGPYNMTAAHPVTNKELTTKASKLLGYPITINAPALALKMVLGEMSQAVLANQNVLPKRALQSGFKFKFEYIDEALQDLIGEKCFIDNQFSSKQFIPLNKSQVFPFFGKAENLETLTPPWLNFHIKHKSTPEIRKGTLIEYKLNIHGLPVKWRTLISDWSPQASFTDEQIKGPYKKWHHVHTFTEVNGGTLICDNVTFRNPGWVFGKLLLPLIKKDVNQIFSYRQKKIKELYQQGLLK